MAKKKNSKVKKKTKLPFLYLDTSIIRSLIEKKSPILVNLMRTVKDRQWKCFTSSLAILELSNLRKDDIYLAKKIKEKAEYKDIIRGRDQKQLDIQELQKVRNYLDNFFKKYPFFTFFQIPTEAWRDALTITINSNMHSIDAIHLAAAVAFEANVLITLDTNFVNEADNFLRRYKYDKKLRVISAEKVFDTLVDLGFKLD